MKIRLNKEKLNEKKFSLMKEKIADISNPESSRVVGGNTGSYYECVVTPMYNNTSGGCPPQTSALAGCSTPTAGPC